MIFPRASIFSPRLQTVQDSKLVNVDIGEVDVVKDPWKINNPPKSR